MLTRFAVIHFFFFPKITIIKTDNPALRRKFVANNNVIDGLFGLLNDHEIGAFALSEITGLLLVDADKKEPVPTVQKGLETLADRCVKYISTFSGGHSSEQDFDSEVSFLHGICDVCQHGKRLQLLFVRSGIFFSLLTLLTLQIPRFPERKALLLDECLCTLYSLFLHNKKAKAGFEASIGYENLKVTLYSFFEYVDQQHVLARLFEIVVESRLAWNPNTLVPTIQNPRMLLFVCELLPLLNRDVAKYVIDKFMFLVKALPNRSICCKNGILTALLEVISSNKIRTGDEDPEEKDATKKEKEKEKGKLALKKSIPFDPEITPSVINVIQALGSYSLNVSELKRIIYILSLSGPSKTRLPEFPYLVNALRTMPTLANVPRSFFDFNGSNSVNLHQHKPVHQPVFINSFFFFFCVCVCVCLHAKRFVLPVLEDEPFAKGFTFCVWIRFESLKRGAQNGAPGISTVFSFSGERQRLELYIQNETPVLRILSYVGSRQPQQQQQDINDKYDVVTFAHCHIPERKWMFLSVAIAPGLINGETKIYLGRDFYDRAVIKFPKLPNLTRNELGRSTDAAGEGRAFFGEMGNIHVFGEPLTQAQICAIYEAGPGYTDVFRSPEFYVDGTFIFNKTFLLSYNALAQRNGSHVMNLTTLGGISDSQVLWRAAKMRNVETSMIRTLKDIIASAEGVFVLFPLILMLGNPPHPGYLSLYSDKQLLVFVKKKTLLYNKGNFLLYASMCV